MDTTIDVAPLAAKSLNIPECRLRDWHKRGWLRLWAIAGGWGLRAEHGVVIDAITVAAKR